MAKDFKVIMEELKVLKKQLNEDYFADGGEGDGMMNGGEDMAPQEGGEVDPRLVQQPQQQQMGQGESEEEAAMHAQEIIQHEPIIGKIREIAIEGLKKYADHPTSEIYNFFKKVFLDADKVLTDGGKGK